MNKRWCYIISKVDSSLVRMWLDDEGVKKHLEADKVVIRTANDQIATLVLGLNHNDVLWQDIKETPYDNK
jgi:hypothetical protein